MPLFFINFIIFIEMFEEQIKLGKNSHQLVLEI